MMKGFYTAASGIFVQQRNINVIGNNIANSQTPGFKTDRVVTSTFSQLVERIENRNKAIIGSESPVSFVDEVPVNLLDSSVEETDRPFDITLIDEGYFNIAGQDKTYMTRNGNFDVDNEGYLVLEGVGRVLGQNGPIRIGTSDFEVMENGDVFSEDYNIYFGKLLITIPAEGTEVTKFNSGMFIAEETQVVQNPQVVQYALERSNIDMNQEYTRLIEAQRALQACSNALQIVDTINAKAATLSSIS